MKPFSYYLSILLKWKKFLLINILLIAIIITIIAFLIPNKYTSTSLLMMPPESSLGGLSSLLGGGKGGLSVGAKMFGIGGSASEDMILGVLYSRSTLEKAIKKFDLIKYYEVKNGSIERTIKEFKNDLYCTVNEYGLIEINVTHENPQISSEISNYLVDIADSSVIALNIQNAKNNKSFIQKRYEESLQDLQANEDSLYNFQKKYGVYAIEQQVEGSIKSSIELESQIVALQLILKNFEQTGGINTPDYKNTQEKINLLENKLNKLQNSGSIAGENIFIPFNKVPEISRDYLRIYRNLETDKAILEVLLPIYETSKVEEQKSIPSILIIDRAVPPMEKSEPKRMIIISGFSMLFLFLLILISLFGDNVTNKEIPENEYEIKSKKFFTSLKKFYRIS